MCTGASRKRSGILIHSLDLHSLLRSHGQPCDSVPSNAASARVAPHEEMHSWIHAADMVNAVLSTARQQYAVATGRRRLPDPPSSCAQLLYRLPHTRHQPSNAKNCAALADSHCMCPAGTRHRIDVCRLRCQEWRAHMMHGNTGNLCHRLSHNQWASRALRRPPSIIGVARID